jgi:TPP-dependent pyruvate/acetoin dehydrogenase alpha subunit
MPEEKKAFYRQIDPCRRGRQFLLELGGATAEEADAIETAVEQAMDEAVAFAKQSPEPAVAEFIEQIRVYS